MGRTVTDLWAPPAPLEMWGATYQSSGILTNNNYYNVELSFESQSEATFNFDVEVTYWKDGEYITERHVLPGSGSISINVGGAGENLSAVSARVKSSGFGQYIQLYADDLYFVPRGFEGEVADEISDAADLFGRAFTSPIVLDLNNNGFELLRARDGVHFDIDADGFAEKTGWVKPADAFLVRDVNGNGVIDSQADELFTLALQGVGKLKVAHSTENDKAIAGNVVDWQASWYTT